MVMRHLFVLLTIVFSLPAANGRAEQAPAAPRFELPSEEAARSGGCRSCHTASDASTMHMNQAVVLGCVDCHGGDATIFRPAGAQPRLAPPPIGGGLAGHAPPVARAQDPV